LKTSAGVSENAEFYSEFQYVNKFAKKLRKMEIFTFVTDRQNFIQITFFRENFVLEVSERIMMNLNTNFNGGVRSADSK
jgi:hypothetical protein